METIATLLIGLGGLSVLLSVVLGIAELATIPTIRAPKRRTFTYMRLADTQLQTVFAPAMGALISGVFVSISASFFYAALTGPQGTGNETAGVVAFIAGAVALMVTLFFFIKVGEPSDLARDPYSIRAAADESAVSPERGGIDPDILTQQLNEWEESISARSMNISKGKSDRLREKLNKAAESRTFWASVKGSLDVYYAALLRFPVRFIWPLLGLPVLMVGVICYAAGPEDLNFATWRPWGAVGLFAIMTAIAILFYCVTRGNRARLWHRIHLLALEEAREAINDAKNAHAVAEAEKRLLGRVIANANEFLQQDHSAHIRSDRTVLRIGRFRVSKLDR